MSKSSSIENFVENLAEVGAENRREYKQGTADYEAGNPWDSTRSKSWSEGYSDALLAKNNATGI